MKAIGFPPAEGRGDLLGIVSKKRHQNQKTISRRKPTSLHEAFLMVVQEHGAHATVGVLGEDATTCLWFAYQRMRNQLPNEVGTEFGDLSPLRKHETSALGVFEHLGRASMPKPGGDMNERRAVRLIKAKNWETFFPAWFEAVEVARKEGRVSLLALYDLLALRQACWRGDVLMSEHNAFGTVAMQVFLCHQNPEDTCLRHLDVSLPAMLEGNHV